MSEALGPGRPSKFTPELATEICDRLATGEPLTEICRGDHMPTDRTVRNWMATNTTFSSDIAHARDVGHDAIAARTRKTARGMGEDDGGDSTGDVQRDKLIIETDLKLLAKWNPRRYGDKHLMVGGGPEDDPIRHAVDLTRLTDEQLAALDGALAAAVLPTSDL
jgi:hypothetical protein